MAEEEKERRETADAKSPEAAEQAAEEARARLAENPWTENPDSSGAFKGTGRERRPIFWCADTMRRSTSASAARSETGKMRWI